MMNSWLLVLLLLMKGSVGNGGCPCLGTSGNKGCGINEATDECGPSGYNVASCSNAISPNEAFGINECRECYDSEENQCQNNIGSMQFPSF